MRVLGVAPESTVTFDLTYDELLERRRGVFEHRVNLWPGQVVDNLVMDIYITEPQGIAQMALNYYPRTSESDGEDLEVIFSLTIEIFQFGFKGFGDFFKISTHLHQTYRDKLTR